MDWFIALDKDELCLFVYQLEGKGYNLGHHVIRIPVKHILDKLKELNYEQ